MMYVFNLYLCDFHLKFLFWKRNILFACHINILESSTGAAATFSRGCWCNSFKSLNNLLLASAVFSLLLFPFFLLLLLMLGWYHCCATIPNDNKNYVTEEFGQSDFIRVNHTKQKINGKWCSCSFYFLLAFWLFSCVEILLFLPLPKLLNFGRFLSKVYYSYLQ